MQGIYAAYATDIASVCCARSWAVQKWMNQSRCRFEDWLNWDPGTVYQVGVHIPHKRGAEGGHLLAYCNVLTHDCIAYCSHACTSKCAKTAMWPLTKLLWKLDIVIIIIITAII